MKFLVKSSPLDEGAVFEADRYRIEEGGALVLWTGSIFEPVLVKAFAPWGWMNIVPAPQDVG